MIDHDGTAATHGESPEKAAAAEFGVTSMFGPLQRVVMRAPGAILKAEPLRWHYAKTLDPDRLNAQYRAFVELVEAAGAEVVWVDEGPTADDGLADSVFTYDPSFVIGDGAVVLRPGKELRLGEAQLHADFYQRLGVPVLGRIESPGVVEGGDLFWLDDNTLAVGRGFRTNQHGIDQLAAIVGAYGVELFVIDLPYYHGPDACLHLLSVISPLDHDLALVHAPLLPTALYQRLREMNIELIRAPAEEFEASLGLNLNVLATGPRQCIAIEGYNRTLSLLREAGCEVATFRADELCIPCEGGPTCLTRPLLRSAAN